MAKCSVSVLLVLVATFGILVRQPTNATSTKTMASPYWAGWRLQSAEPSTAIRQSTDFSGTDTVVPSPEVIASGLPAAVKDVSRQDEPAGVLSGASADQNNQAVDTAAPNHVTADLSNSDVTAAATTPKPHATVDVLRERPIFVAVAKATVDTLREKPTTANVPHATIDVLRAKPVVVTAADTDIWVHPSASIDVLRAAEEKPSAISNAGEAVHVTSTTSVDQVSSVHTDGTAASPSVAVPANPFQRVFYLSRPKRTSSAGGSRAMGPGVSRTASSQPVQPRAAVDVLRSRQSQTPLPITSTVRGTSLLELDEADSDMPLLMADQY